MNQSKQWENKIREQWHVRIVNMAQEVEDYSKVEGLIFEWWIEKIHQGLENKRVELLGLLLNEIGSMKRNLKEPEARGSGQGQYNAGLQDAISIIEKHL